MEHEGDLDLVDLFEKNRNQSTCLLRACPGSISQHSVISNLNIKQTNKQTLNPNPNKKKTQMKPTHPKQQKNHNQITIKSAAKI